jgi:hypothetical protein
VRAIWREPQWAENETLGAIESLAPTWRRPVKPPSWQFLLGLALVALSVMLYLAHYAIFRDAHHVFIYLIGDIAFVPVEVLLVTLVIHRLLNARERKSRLEKLNMVIGAFFSEIGTDMLAHFSDLDPNLDRIREDLLVTADWSDSEFLDVGNRLRKYDYMIDIEKADLERLRALLLGKRDFLARLLENPTLLEHESFTDLLRSVFHLTEELSYRSDLAELPETDYQHLAGDIRRAYVYLASEWLDYMKHLKHHYPYLFSLSIRTNPFDQDASPVLA